MGVPQCSLTGRVEVNAGMLVENLIAQMLRASGINPYFHVEFDPRTGVCTMEVDFLVEKQNLQRRHNISPIEVKSAGEYATKSLDKFIAKFSAYSSTPYVLHPKDVEKSSDRVSLPLYMAGLLMR